jgi:DUF2934 family protein
MNWRSGNIKLMGKKTDSPKQAARNATASPASTNAPAAATVVTPTPVVPAPTAAAPARPAATAPAKRTAAPKKRTTTPKKPAAAPLAISQDDVALRAYFIAEKRQREGLPGDSTSDWVEAERQLRAELTGKKPRAKAGKSGSNGSSSS